MSSSNSPTVLDVPPSHFLSLKRHYLRLEILIGTYSFLQELSGLIVLIYLGLTSEGCIDLSGLIGLFYVENGSLFSLWAPFPLYCEVCLLCDLNKKLYDLDCNDEILFIRADPLEIFSHFILFIAVMVSPYLAE
jgi:hypothetical protein